MHRKMWHSWACGLVLSEWTLLYITRQVNHWLSQLTALNVHLSLESECTQYFYRGKRLQKKLSSAMSLFSSTILIKYNSNCQQSSSVELMSLGGGRDYCLSVVSSLSLCSKTLRCVYIHLHLLVCSWQLQNKVTFRNFQAFHICIL